MPAVASGRGGAGILIGEKDAGKTLLWCRSIMTTEIFLIGSTQKMGTGTLPWCRGGGLQPQKFNQPPGDPGFADAAVVVPWPLATEMPGSAPGAAV
ncbi:hypothetical protein [Streptomyces nigrescens]